MPIKQYGSLGLKEKLQVRHLNIKFLYQYKSYSKVLVFDDSIFFVSRNSKGNTKIVVLVRDVAHGS